MVIMLSVQLEKDAGLSGTHALGTLYQRLVISPYTFGTRLTREASYLTTPNTDALLNAEDFSHALRRDLVPGYRLSLS